MNVKRSAEPPCARSTSSRNCSAFREQPSRTPSTGPTSSRPSCASGSCRRPARAGYVGPDPDRARALPRHPRRRRARLHRAALLCVLRPAAVLILEGIARACEEAETGLLLVPSRRQRRRPRPSGRSTRAAVDAFALVLARRRRPGGRSGARPRRPDRHDRPADPPGVPYVGHDHRSAARSRPRAPPRARAPPDRRARLPPHPASPHAGEVSRQQQLAAGYRHTRSRLEGYGDALSAPTSTGTASALLRERVERSRTAVPRARCHARAAGSHRRRSSRTPISSRSAPSAAAEMLASACPTDLSVIGMDDIPAACHGHAGADD